MVIPQESGKTPIVWMIAASVR